MFRTILATLVVCLAVYSVSSEGGGESVDLPLATARASALEAWLRDAGATLEGVTISVEASDLDEGGATYRVVSTRILDEGDVVVQLPGSVILSVTAAMETALGAAWRQQGMGFKSNDDTLLALFLLFEVNKGEASFYNPYLVTLPLEFHTALYYAPPEQRWFNATVSVYSKLGEEMEKRTVIYREVVSPFVNANPDVFASLGLTEEAWWWACDVVAAHSTRVGRKPMLAPLLDMFSRHPSGSLPVAMDTASGTLTATIGSTSVVSSAGNLVFQGYPPTVKTNADILLTYGELLAPNDQDAVLLEIAWPTEDVDPLIPYKLDMIEKREGEVSTVFSLYNNTVPRLLFLHFRVMLMDSEDFGDYATALKNKPINSKNELRVLSNLQRQCEHLADRLTNIEADILKAMDGLGGRFYLWNEVPHEASLAQIHRLLDGQRAILLNVRANVLRGVQTWEEDDLGLREDGSPIGGATHSVGIATEELLDTIGDYSREAVVLGEGGDATVYAGFKTGTLNKVAVKVAAKAVAGENGGVISRTARLTREIRIHSTLSHPHIIELLYSQETAANIYIVMEFGGSHELFEYVQESDGLDESQAKPIFKALASAVGALHDAGVVHRDLKMSNVLLDPSAEDVASTVRLLDFGSAATFAAGSDNDWFSSADGTTKFYPPELIRKEFPYKGRSVDVWNMGILLYSMCEFRVPFVTEADTLSGNMRMPTTPFSPELADLISSMLNTNAEARATMKDVLAHPWLQ